MSIIKEPLPQMNTTETASLKNEIDALTEKYVHIWWELCNKPAARCGKTADFWTKRRRQINTDSFLNQFTKIIKCYPDNAQKIMEWKEEVKNLIEDFIQQIEFININEMKFLLSQGILEATEVFVREARNFDKDMKIEDIGQAMRNVWIMNIIQVLLNIPVECTLSVFAYSMLYPYTDNYIDDEGISRQQKQAYSLRFDRRLRGEIIEPENKYENKIFSLVDLIEKQYRRSKYPQVYGSLIGIHRGQNKSMLQHKINSTPYDMDILGISMEKGGTSVLADGFLVKGDLNPLQIEFLYAYGVMLQLCDDLQDVKTDIKNNHNTIFSLTAKAWHVDNITDALFNLVDYVVQLIDKLEIENPELLKRIIKENCCLLIYFAIGKNEAFYSREYIKAMKGYLPYNIRYIKRFSGQLSKKYSSLKPSYNGVSTEKILLEGIKALGNI